MTPSDFGKLPRLKELRRLNLASPSNFVDDYALEMIAKCEKLEELDIRYATRFTAHGIKHLSGLKNLSHLKMLACELDDSGIAHIARLPALHHLEIAGCKRISDVGAQELGESRSLRYISLNGIRQITAGGLEYLGHIPTLTELDLRGTGISDEALNDWLKRHPTCNASVR